MRDVIKDICTRVEGGDSFSDALAEASRRFSTGSISRMVSAGEKGGLLAEILARLATYLENTARLRKKVKSAMMYPTVVTVVAIGITIFLLVKVVPVFGGYFQLPRRTLPTPTLYLINISNFVKHYFILFVLAAGARLCGWLYYIKTPAGPAFLGRQAHQAADLRPHRPQDLPGPLYPHAWPRWSAAACPSWKCLGIVQNTVGNVVMENGHQDRRHGHRARRRHFHRPGQASRFSRP